MSVRDTLSKIENLVAGASHFPLTKKAIIDEEDLLRLIDEFRKELPQELGHAEEIIREREEIIHAAQQDSEKIIREAEKKAQALVDESDVVIKARDKAQSIETQAYRHANEIVTNARNQARQYQDSVQIYANQVLDSLSQNVTTTFNEVQNLNACFRQALQVLQQSKVALNQQAYNQSQVYNQPQDYNQPPNPNYPPNTPNPNYPQNPQNPQT